MLSQNAILLNCAVSCLRVHKVVHLTKRSRVFRGSTDLKSSENGLHKPLSERTLRYRGEIDSNHPKMSVLTRYGVGIYDHRTVRFGSRRKLSTRAHIIMIFDMKVQYWIEIDVRRWIIDLGGCVF